jgi:hypothetical protein
VRTRQIYETIDRQPYQWIVVLVAGIGFFIDGYTVRILFYQPLTCFSMGICGLELHADSH